MSRILHVLGALALLAWTALGLLAWSSFSEGLTVTVLGPKAAGSEEVDPDLLLRDSVASLRADLSALASALERNVGPLVEAVRKESQLDRAELSRRLGELDLALAALADRRAGSAALLVEEVPESLAAESAPGETLADGPGPTAGAEEPPKDEPAAERPPASFLAFRLPSDDFVLDENRRWTVLPELSRVGFDGRSTLHDFTGATSAVAGEFEANLARPDHLEGVVTVEIRSLTTGLDDRDEAMREHLAAEEHPELSFELVGFRPAPSGAEGEGLALGKMTIRGVTRPLDVPIRWELDAAHRLLVEGEAPLRLPDWDVPVPNKLGMIKMDEEVRIWLSLRARVLPRSSQ